MPHASSFCAVETGGLGDCADTSAAIALARIGRSNAKASDLQPGGRLQGHLRCEAAKWVRGHSEDFGGPSSAISIATSVSTHSVHADTPALFTLAKALTSSGFSLFARLQTCGDSIPSAMIPRRPPQKAEARAKISVMLELINQHYR